MVSEKRGVHCLNKMMDAPQFASDTFVSRKKIHLYTSNKQKPIIKCWCSGVEYMFEIEM